LIKCNGINNVVINTPVPGPGCKDVREGEASQQVLNKKRTVIEAQTLDW